jgi:DNA-binding XRE family transcriptional regulator
MRASLTLKTMMNNPTPAEIRAAREAAGLTQQEAGELIHGSRRAWQDYESGARKMHPGLWELFQAKAQACDAGRQEDNAA